jgi:hypothetical protein
MREPLRRYSTPNWMKKEMLEDRNCDGKMVLFKTREYLGLRIGRKPPSTEMNGQNFSRRPGPTKGCCAMMMKMTRKQTKKNTNKSTLLAFKIIVILHNTLLATFIKLLETVTHSWIAATSEKPAPFMMLFRWGNRKKSTHLTPLIWHLWANVTCVTEWMNK